MSDAMNFFCRIQIYNENGMYDDSTVSVSIFLTFVTMTSKYITEAYCLVHLAFYMNFYFYMMALTLKISI